MTLSDFQLVQVDILDANGNMIRTSYEVLEPNEDVIGRFGSLKEAQHFINLLCHLDHN